MKWIKFKSAYGNHAAGATVEIDDNEAGFIVKSGMGEETATPAEVATKATQLEEAVVDRLVQKAIAGIGDRLVIETKGQKPGYRPRIETHDNPLDDPTDGFKSLNEFARCVHKACVGHGVDPRLTLRLKANGASENVNADGGYATPVEYATTVFNDVQAQDSLFNEVTKIPMASNSIKLPAINYTKQGSYGVTANWEGEGATIPTSKPAFRQPQLTLNKLTALVPVTNELLEDGIGVESLINFLAAQAITWKVNDAIINGTGAGMPTGIVGHGSTVKVSRNTGSHVKVQDVIGMNAAFLPFLGGAETSGVWLLNKVDVEPELLTIADGGGRYLYFAPGSVPADPRGRLLGKPVRALPNCAALGTSGDIILADLKGYVMGYKSTGINKAMSIHLYFNTDEVAYRWTFRLDGRPWRDTTLSAANGSNAYGNFCTL